jgi:predicted Zn-dependent peptidase
MTSPTSRPVLRSLLAAGLLAAAAGCTSDAADTPPEAAPAAPGDAGPSSPGKPAAPQPAGAAEPAKTGVTTIDAGVPGDGMGVTIHRLSNGIVVYLSENHEQPRLDVWMTTRAGGAKDPADATGMAHYLEHMLFKGSPRIGTLDWEKEKPHLDRITALYDELFGTTDPAKRTELYAAIDRENQEASKYAVPNEFDRIGDQIGAQGTNAFTSTDQTSYVMNIPSNRIRQWADVQYERLREPVYRLFQTEIESVYEEKNRSLDNKAWATRDALFGALFPQHPYGTQTIIGTVEHLKNPSLTKMHAYFTTWYVPGNMCVAMAGDFDKAEVLRILEDTVGRLPAKPFPEDPKWPIAPPQGVKRVEIVQKGEETVQIAFLTVPAGHADYPALVLCDMMLTNGKTGLIDRNLNQAQAVRQAGSSPQALLDAGYQLLVATPKPGQTLEELEQLLLAQVENLKKGEFTDDDLRAVLTNFEIDEKRGLESNNNRVAQMTDSFVTRRPWSDYVGFIPRLKKLSKTDVVAAANKYFGPNRVVVMRRDGQPELPTIEKPGFTPVPIDPSRRSAWVKELVERKVPDLEPRFVVKGRDVDTVALGTGTLVRAENPVNDVFDLSFTIPVGTDRDPRLSLALSLLDLGGAGDLDGIALKRKLYALGSTWSAGAGRDETTISVSGIESNLAATVDLLRKHFDKPTGVGQADLDKLVQRVLAARKAQKSDPRGVSAALAEYAQRGPESTFLRQPTNDEIAKWKAEDLLSAARDLWKWRRIVTFSGRMPAAELAKVVDLAPLGGGEAAEAPARKPLAYVVPEKNRVLLLDRKTAQTDVRVFGPDGTFDRTQVPFSRVYNEYMGGSMSGVVFQEIRESRALAYDAGAGYRVPPWKDDQNLVIGALGTQADKTLDALDVLLGLIRALPPSDARFELAVSSIDQGYRSVRPQFRSAPDTWVTWMRQGLDGDPRPWNWSQVKAMKLPDLLAWTKRFEAMPMTIAIAGPKDRFDAERLRKFGDVTELTTDQLFAW